MRIILFFTIILALGINTNAQCFGSPGNPVAGTSNAGSLQKKLFRTSLYHRYSYSDTYRTGSKITGFSLYEKANYNYLGLTLAYGLTDKITIESETGYFVNKTIHYNSSLILPESEYTKSGFGLSHTLISLKYLIIPDNKHPIRWAIGAGGRIPLRQQPQYENNSLLPQDVQPSNMAFGIALQSFFVHENSFKGRRIFLINRYEYYFENSQQFQWGQVLYNSLFYSKRLHFKQQWLTENWTGILQLRHEYRTHNYNYLLTSPKVAGSGNNLIFITPQLNYTHHEILNISFLADIPVYQYYNETQLSNKFSFTLNITRDFPPK